MSEQATQTEPSVARDDIEAAIAGRRRERATRKRRSFLAIRLISLAVVLGAWQLYGMHTQLIIFPTITEVIRALPTEFSTYGLAGAIWYSLWTFGIGYVIGLLAGVVIGMCIGLYRKAEAGVGLYLQALYATPMVAIVPVLTIWLGYGVLTQEFIIGLFVVFPCVVTVSVGVRNLDSDLLEVARSLRMSRSSLWRHVLLPGTVPYIAAGAAQGVAMGLVGMFLAEIYTELTGLGNALQSAAQTYHTDRMFAVLLVIMTLGVVLRTLINLVQRRSAPWMK